MEKEIGTKMWVSGNGFVLYQTDDIGRYFGMDVKNITLKKQEVLIIEKNRFMLENGDIFLL